MPIDYRIDDTRRLVMARGHGVVTHEDVFGYQRDAWSRPGVAGYDELVDMSDVEDIAVPVPADGHLRTLANESATSDAPASPSKFAIVARENLAYGLGRMYQAFRELEPRGNKEVRVFRDLSEAVAFLGHEGLKPWES